MLFEIASPIKYCSQCNRILKSDESILLGIGPECYKKLIGKNIKKPKSSSDMKLFKAIEIGGNKWYKSEEWNQLKLWEDLE